MKKLKKKTIKRITEGVVSLIALLILWFIGAGDILDNNEKNVLENVMINEIKEETNRLFESTYSEDKLYLVTKVVDGDTLEIDYNGTKEKLRLIGVDTPESVHPTKSKNTEEGKIASEYTKSLLENKYIKIEFDVQLKDQYGRLLGYVYINDEMVNKKLLEEGYAHVATYPPNVKYVDDFTEIQKTSRENNKGFWDTDVFN